MPELPEVETICRDLNACLPGLTVSAVKVFDDRVVRGCAAAAFSRRLKGRTFVGIERRGKALILYFAETPFSLVVQLMMTGQLIYAQPGPAGKVTKVAIALSNGNRLLYNDQRLFGRLQLVDDLAAFPYFQKLGIEPLSADFSAAWLTAQLPRHKTAVKTLLLNHQFVAGIGNIYAAEILFVARINPLRSAADLTAAEVKRLFSAIGTVLSAAIEQRGTSVNTYRDAAGEKGRYVAQLQVYGREGEACRCCHQPVQRIMLSGRSTFFCRHCQK